MPVTYPDLETHLNAIGNAIILVGDPSVASGMAVLGLKEGEATVAWNETESNLTAPDQAGDTIFEGYVLGQNPVVTLPIIVGDPSLYATLSPTGSAGGGSNRPVDYVTTSLFLIPEKEFGDSFAYDGAAWTTGLTPPTTPPAHSVFFWRGYFRRTGLSFRSAEGGKRVESAEFQVMWGKTGVDPALTLPDGLKMFYIGNPVAAGVTDLLI